jgi:Ca2+-binding EF-hand superfamily protein
MSQTSTAALVTARLRSALAGLPRTVLASAFPATASAGDSHTLTFQAIRKGFETLGIELDAEELQDIVDVFDVNGDGRISAEEWNQWISEEKHRGESGAGSFSGPRLEDSVQLQHQIRGILLGLDEDELKKWFQDEATGQLRVLSAEELTNILLDLNLPASAVGVPLQALLKKIDSSNDGNISFAELSAFVAQKRFAHTITNMLTRAAVKLRARGVSLPSVLLSAALRVNPRAVAGLSPTDYGRVALTPANLKEVLVCQLGLPLDEAKLVALTCLADVDGNNACEIGEICSLCGETIQGLETLEAPDILQALASPSDEAIGEEWLGSDDRKETDDWWQPLPLSSLLSSPYPGMEAGARQESVLLPATMWNDVVTSVFDAALSSMPSTSGGTASSSPLTSTQLSNTRVLQVWAALGFHMSAAAATSLLQPHEVSPGMVDKAAYVKALDGAVEQKWRQGRLGLQRLARDRLVAAIMVRLY